MILEQEADIILFQETSADGAAASRFKTAARGLKWQCVLGPVDPNVPVDAIDHKIEEFSKRREQLRTKQYGAGA